MMAETTPQFEITDEVIASIRARCADVEIEPNEALITCGCCGMTIITGKGSAFYSSAVKGVNDVYTSKGICADCHPIMVSNRHPRYCAHNREMLIEKSIEALHAAAGTEIEVALEERSPATPEEPMRSKKGP